MSAFGEHVKQKTAGGEKIVSHHVRGEMLSNDDVQRVVKDCMGGIVWCRQKADLEQPDDPMVTVRTPSM